MEAQNYHKTISVNISPDEALKKISNVQEWWSEHFEGSAQNTGDVFKVHFGKTNKTFKITEVLPGSRLMWEVIDCNMPWLKDIKEWNGTKVVWEALKTDSGTEVRMTHIGLVPEVECYTACEKGWNYYIDNSLLKLLTEGKGMPEKAKQSAT